MICFSTEYDILESLFTHLWALSTAFVLMQVKKTFIHPYSTIYYPVYTKLKWYQLFTINTVNELLKSFYFQRLVLWEYLDKIFWFNPLKTEAVIIVSMVSIWWFLYDNDLRLERVKISVFHYLIKFLFFLVLQ